MVYIPLLLQAVPGDYFYTIHQKTLIPFAKLISDNKENIGRQLDAPLAGKLLTLCNPQPGVTTAEDSWQHSSLLQTIAAGLACSLCEDFG